MAELFKRDLCRAYRQLPVDPLDYPLLAYLWEDFLYFDKVLPKDFVHRQWHVNASCWQCYICDQLGFDILNYLDDFMGVAPQQQGWEAYHFLGRLLSHLGLRESANKAVAPSTFAMVIFGRGFCH